VLAGLIDPCGVVAAANVAKILEQAVITDLEQIKNRQLHETRKTSQGVHQLCVIVSSRGEYSPLLCSTASLMTRFNCLFNATLQLSL